jgi:hypothetical protein
MGRRSAPGRYVSKGFKGEETGAEKIANGQEGTLSSLGVLSALHLVW